jgi:nicotinamide-nucleotide amidase
MPGVPREMREMFTAQVVPALVAMRGEAGGSFAQRHFVVHGVPESQLGAALAGIARRDDDARTELMIGTRVSCGTIGVRVRARAPSCGEAAGLVDAAAEEVRRRIGDAIAGEGDRELAYFAVESARARGVTMALAESCTGGLIAAKLVSVPGASAVFREAVVAYANESKTHRLGVPVELLARAGAVSAEAARAMAEGARRGSGADIAAATTGVAGPEGGSPEKPVGLVFIACASESGTEVVEKRFRGDRDAIRERAAQTALWLLLRAVERHPVRLGAGASG